ncbi:MAG: hypothetical protein KY459_04805 [Acidobacteria bacterium]|nr:hypothetical protein [Acidobacteriota bacterium]
MVVRKVGAVSLGKIMGIIYAVFGLIVGVLLALVSLMWGAEGAEAFGGMMMGGFSAIIIAPIVYGITGFIAGIISALIYNVAAGWVGGIELEIEGATHVAPARTHAPAVT